MTPNRSPAASAGRRLRLVPLAMTLAMTLAVSGAAAWTAHASADPVGPAMTQGRAGDHRGPHGGGKPMSGAGHGMDRLLGQIGATDAQRAQIDRITQSARAEGRARREAGMALRGQMAALAAQPSIDTDAVEAVRQQMLALHDQASQRRTQRMLEVAQVLTPEQRAQVAAHMQARAERMKARHAAGARRAP